MSDEHSVQDKAAGFLQDTLVKVDRNELAKLLYKVMASKHLMTYVQSVATENKMLIQRNGNLEKQILNSNKTFSQMVVGSQQRLRQSRVKSPSHFNFDSLQPESYQSLEPRFLSSGSRSLQVQGSHVSNSGKSSESGSSYYDSSIDQNVLDSTNSNRVLFIQKKAQEKIQNNSQEKVQGQEKVHENVQSQGVLKDVLLERGNICDDTDEETDMMEKSDMSKKEEVEDQSLTVDGEALSMHAPIQPVFHHHKRAELPVDTICSRTFPTTVLSPTTVPLPTSVPSPTSIPSPTSVPLPTSASSFISVPSPGSVPLSSSVPSPTLIPLPTSVQSFTSVPSSTSNSTSPPNLPPLVVAHDDSSMVKEVHMVYPGVSKQYFDVVVKELAKSKQLVKQLIANSGKNPKDVMDAVYMKQMVETYEAESKKLTQANENLKNLLVSQDTTFPPANAQIFSLRDKVQKLERQVYLKNIALDQLHKQCEVWKSYGQRTEQVHTAPIQHTSSQTDTPTLASAITQTEAQAESRQFPGQEGQAEVLLARSRFRVAELENMLGDVTLDNKRTKENLDMLLAHNQSLTESYEQVLESLAEVERNQDVMKAKEHVRNLNKQIADKNKTLKDNEDEMKYLRYQVQSNQSDLGVLGQQKTRTEAMLKSERERANQRELQLFTQCSKLQQQINKLQSENKKLHSKLSLSDIPPVQTTIKEVYMEPASFPLMSYKPSSLWQQDCNVVGQTSEGRLGLSECHQSDPCIINHRLSSDDDQFFCHHCLRTDFLNEKSFNQHMQKCGD